MRKAAIRYSLFAIRYSLLAIYFARITNITFFIPERIANSE